MVVGAACGRGEYSVGNFPGGECAKEEGIVRVVSLDCRGNRSGLKLLLVDKSIGSEDDHDRNTSMLAVRFRGHRVVLVAARQI